MTWPIRSVVDPGAAFNPLGQWAIIGVWQPPSKASTFQ